MTLPVVRDSIPIIAWRWVSLELDDDRNNPGQLSDEVRVGSIWRFGRLDRVSDAVCGARHELIAWGMQLAELRRREAGLAAQINKLRGKSRTETQFDLDRVRNDIQWLEHLIEQRAPAGVIHDVPHPNCTCGFYALPSKRDLMMTYTIMGNAIALVQLSGTVIEHDNGYRAERQTILQITDVTCGHGAGCGHGKDRGPAKYLVREDAKARVLTPYCEDCMRLYPQYDSSRIYDLDAELERLGIPGPER